MKSDPVKFLRFLYKILGVTVSFGLFFSTFKVYAEPSSASPSKGPEERPAPPALTYRYECVVTVSSELADYERRKTFLFDQNTEQFELKDVATWEAFSPEEPTAPIHAGTASTDCGEKYFNGHSITLTVDHPWSEETDSYLPAYQATATVMLQLDAGGRHFETVGTTNEDFEAQRISAGATFRTYLANDYANSILDVSVNMKCTKKN